MRKQLTLVFATLALSTVAFAQLQVTGLDGPFQIGYAANLNIGDSVVNLSNDGVGGGLVGTAHAFGNLCVNVYAFDPQEEEIACCACLVTPNGLNSLSVQSDLISNPLTPAIPTSVIIKLLSSVPSIDNTGTLTVCNPTTAGLTFDTALRPGMLAWGTTLGPSASPGTYNAVNVPFIQGSLTSAGFLATPVVGGYNVPPPANVAPAVGTELYSLTSLCAFIQGDGSGFGICKSCRTGGLSGSKK
jgi:hypothetical protein